jgi:hypothetical protein
MAGIPVTIVGELTHTGLGVGGGPMPGGPSVSHPIAPGGPPPQIWPGPGVPTHPIVIPPGSLGPGVPAHPIYIPVYPAHPIVIPPDAIAPGVPTHPIYIPPGIWGGGNEPFPTPPIVIIPQPPGGKPPVVIWPSPGHPEHPIVIPLPPIDAKPEHPIVLPPQIPPGIWGGANEGFPTQPIVIPPLDERQKLVEWDAIWTLRAGWIVVGTPVVPIPTPSKR